MTLAGSLNHLSVDEYLAGELSSEVKHEYLAGVVYAMAGGTNAHNLLATNFLGSVHARLRGSECRAFNSDTKIRIQLPMGLRFYYPDGSIVCRPNPQQDSFQEQPTVVAEVLSRKTRRTDEGEKKDAYLSIPSLCCYLLIEQETQLVTVYRRTETGFAREVHVGTEATIALPEVGAELPLAELYDGVELTPEPADDEGDPG